MKQGQRTKAKTQKPNFPSQNLAFDMERLASKERHGALSLLRNVSISQEEAEFLLMGIKGLKRHELYLSPVEMSSEDVQRFSELAKRAEAGAPVQYLTHSAPFLDLDLYVDERVFIPRPETEELVLRTAARVRSPKGILDYGTGSGCIAIALARIFPEAQIWAVDVSRETLMVAEKNICRYNLFDRIKLFRAERLTELRLVLPANAIDILLANPPYIPSNRLKLLPKKVRDYEPHIALDGGEKGVEVLTMLLREGTAFLAPDGLMALEIDSTQGEFVKELVPGAEIERDLSGQVRYAFIKPLTAVPQ